jgi:hypothetical protein
MRRRSKFRAESAHRGRRLKLRILVLWQFMPGMNYSCYGFSYWRGARRTFVIAGSAAKTQISKAPISPFSMATRPSWVADQERASPGTSFWQIHFDPSETKTKNEVNAFLPSELIPLLEEYLSIHRPVLVGKSDPGTLFVSSTGRPMKVGQVRSLVTKLASAHARRTCHTSSVPRHRGI